MGKIFRILTGLMALLLVLPSCSKEDPFPGDGTGDATGTVNFRKMVVEVNASENMVRASEVNVGEFVVEVKSSVGVAEYAGTYAEMPEVITLPVGDYTVTVKSPSNPDAAWESPYYEGSQDFSVKENDVTFVDPVVCRLGNVKVTVKYDPALQAVMSDDCAVTVQTGVGGQLSFAKTETRSGHFRYVAGEGTATLVATFRGTVEGNPEENFRTYTDVAPGNHYIITYRLKSPGGDTPDMTGTVTPGVNVDAVVEVVDMNVNVDVEDDVISDTDRPQQGDGPGKPDDPTPPTPGGDAPTVVATINGETDYTSPVTVTSEMSVKVKVTSETGITAFTVDIVSDTLTPETLGSVNLTDHLDLVSPGQYEEALVGLGFPVNVGGMKDVPEFDISQLVPLLGALGPGDHRFILTVTDTAGTTVETLYFVTK